MILIDTDIYKIQTSSFMYQTNQDSCYIWVRFFSSKETVLDMLITFNTSSDSEKHIFVKQNTGTCN